MSKIEVDAIDKQSGSTLTLGGSGTAVTLASGATQSGFGRTGTVDWQTGSIKTSTFTAANGEGYFANTSGSAFTMNLPAGTAGNIVSVVDYTNTFQTNNLTVAANGSQKIGGVQATAALSTQGQSVTFVYVDDTEGWKNIQDSTSNVTGAVPFMVATVSGACNTLATAPDCANTKIATFTGPGTFCVSQIAIGPTAPANNIVSYMVVAGGGSGGYGASGGGGAGGFREGKSPVTPYTASPLNAPTGLEITSAGPISVTVGGGGAANPYPSGPNNGNQGSNSIFSSITSAGGGAAGGRGNPGSPGGSGGGWGGDSGHHDESGTGNTPPTNPPQGQPGGAPTSPGVVCGSTCAGAGGGGATAAGAGWPGSRGVGTSGGAGATSSITASPVARAGGGGGSARTSPGPGSAGSGGTGGGGNGANGPGPSTSNPGGAGTVNTGGGGGGSATNSDGGAGGSGIVVIRYRFQ